MYGEVQCGNQLIVRNTFISVEHGDGEDLKLGGIARKRLVTEPAPSMYSAPNNSAGAMTHFAQPVVDLGGTMIASLAGGDMAQFDASGQGHFYGGGFGMVPAGSEAPPPEWQNKTTVMMRSMPNKYSQKMLITEINDGGFLGTFDFLYLPIDVETNANKGYAFLNFVDSSFAWMFRLFYQGRKMNHFNSSKIVAVTPATLQGFEANYAHYSNARVNRGDPACRPLFLREPQRPVAAPGDAVRGRHRRGGRSDRFAEAQRQQEMTQAAVEEAPQQMVGRPAPAPPSQLSPEGLVRQFCHQCGAKVQPTFAFCVDCGSSVDLAN